MKFLFIIAVISSLYGSAYSAEVRPMGCAFVFTAGFTPESLEALTPGEKVHFDRLSETIRSVPDVLRGVKYGAPISSIVRPGESPLDLIIVDEPQHDPAIIRRDVHGLPPVVLVPVYFDKGIDPEAIPSQEANFKDRTGIDEQPSGKIDASSPKPFQSFGSFQELLDAGKKAGIDPNPKEITSAPSNPPLPPKIIAVRNAVPVHVRFNKKRYADENFLLLLERFLNILQKATAVPQNLGDITMHQMDELKQAAQDLVNQYHGGQMDAASKRAFFGIIADAYGANSGLFTEELISEQLDVASYGDLRGALRTPARVLSLVEGNPVTGFSYRTLTLLTETLELEFAPQNISRAKVLDNSSVEAKYLLVQQIDHEVIPSIKSMFENTPYHGEIGAALDAIAGSTKNNPAQKLSQIVSVITKATAMSDLQILLTFGSSKVFNVNTDSPVMMTSLTELVSELSQIKLIRGYRYSVILNNFVYLAKKPHLILNADGTVKNYYQMLEAKFDEFGLKNEKERFQKRHKDLGAGASVEDQFDAFCYFLDLFNDRIINHRADLSNYIARIRQNFSLGTQRYSVTDVDSLLSHIPQSLRMEKHDFMGLINKKLNGQSIVILTPALQDYLVGFLDKTF